jgi:hypothetical protein
MAESHPDFLVNSKASIHSGRPANLTAAMKTIIPCFFVAIALFPLNAHGQGRSNDFQITKINKNLITNPQYTYSGAEQYQANQRDRWLEVEVEFTAAPDFTDELTFKYFILVNGKVLTGEVTHANIAAGREKRSVMYVPPQALASFLGNRPVTPTSVQNIAVQIAQQGALKDELSLTRAAPRWYASVPQLAGFLLNKNETPFAPLYWDRYEQIKPGTH